VMEEEELAAMRAHQEHFEQIRNAELVATQRMEAAEKRKLDEKERRLAQERDRLEREKQVRCATQLVQVSIGPLKFNGGFNRALVLSLLNVGAPCVRCWRSRSPTRAEPLPRWRPAGAGLASPCRRITHQSCARLALLSTWLFQTLAVEFFFGESFGGEQKSVATAQAARGLARPPCRHFKIQSFFCPASASRRLSKPHPSRSTVQGWTR
jgi:hypothetical protein